MRIVVFTFLLAASALLGRSQTVTNVAFDAITHSAFRATLWYQGEFNAIRARYVPLPGSCADGVAGQVQAIGFYTRFAPMPVIVSGLQAATQYHICPELSSDGGNTWSKGVEWVVTTLPLPEQHPALPIPPEKFNSDYPDTSSFFKVSTDRNCSDLHDLLASAVIRSLETGTVIELPMGATCIINPMNFSVNPPDLLWFGSDAVDVASNTLTLPKHYLTEGQKIQIVNHSIYWSGSLPQTAPAALADGQSYYAHVLDANTIQVYFNAPANRGGSLLTFTSQGGGHNYVVPLPRRVKPIIVQAMGANASLPEHVRVNPSEKGKMTRLVMPRSQIGGGPLHYMFRFSDHDAGIRRAIGHLRFVGIEFMTEDFADLHTTIDPPPYENILIMSPWNSQITIDRCYVHSPGAPTRWNKGMFWDGAYVSIIDSYHENLTYFRATNENITASLVDGTHAQISPGTSYSGSSTHKLSAPVTIAISGTGSGRVLTGWDLQADRFTVWTPPGLDAVCIGVACVTATYSSSSDGTCGVTDAWPRNSSGWVSAHPTGCFTVAHGVLNAVAQGELTKSEWFPEGCNYMIGGRGPGPYKLINTMIEGAGLPWHHDDSGGTKYNRGDYDYERNTFHADSRFRFGSAQSDHLMYSHRQSLEWKSGERLYLRGNIIDGGWVENNPASVMVTLTAVNGQTIRDVNFELNEFRHGPGALNIMIPTPGGTPVVAPPQRFRFHGNLVWDINSGAETTCDGQPSYYVANGAWPCSTGWVFQGPYGSEDVTVDYNTFIGISGRVPSLFRLGAGPVEGFSVTHNILSFVDQGLTLESMAAGESCSNLSGKQLADCKLPGYTISDNVILGQSGGFSGTPNILAEASSSSRYINPSFSTTPNSNGAGADIAALRAAQGLESGSADSECTNCSPATVSISFLDSVDGAKIFVYGPGCDSGSHDLPATLKMVTGSSCSVRTTPPNGYSFESWDDSSTINPRTFIVPSSNSRFTVTFSALENEPAATPDLQPKCTTCLPTKPLGTPPTSAIPNPSAGGLRYVPIAPCRVMDTREHWEVGGGPAFKTGESRTLSMISTRCALSAAEAYAINVTVVPGKKLRWLTVWPTGKDMPFTSLLNSYDGRIKSAASIVGAGDNSGIDIFATDETDIVIDVSGYFVSESESTFHLMQPCRIVDTRIANGLLGFPSIPALTERSLPILGSDCGLPASAEAYSVNLTAIPKGNGLTWMSAWPSGLERPFASSLNDSTKDPVANSAIVRRGLNGDISVYGSDDFDMVIDITGYFAPQPGGYSFYPISPCRLIDTRESGTRAVLNGTMGIDTSGKCNIPVQAKALAGMITAVPQQSLEWLTVWGEGEQPPLASTLNAYDAAVTSNFTITPLNDGAFNVFAKNPTHVIFDVMGYFAP